jgi:hypothetical protein
MMKRLVVGLAATSLLATGIAVGSAQAAQAAQAECLDWKQQGLDPKYCYVSRKKAHVWVTFANTSDREVRLRSLSGLNLKLSRDFVMPPGKRVWLVGYASKGVDAVADLSWCPTVKYTTGCTGELTAKLSWKNPAIGWPWMKVQADVHGFRSMERYTFKEPYGHAASKGVATFTTQRLTDYPGGAKVYNVDFTFAAPVTRPRR